MINTVQFSGKAYIKGDAGVNGQMFYIERLLGWEKQRQGADIKTWPVGSKGTWQGTMVFTNEHARDIYDDAKRAQLLKQPGSLSASEVITALEEKRFDLSDCTIKEKRIDTNA